MKNGTSQFDYDILDGTVTLNVTIDWDEYGDGEITEVLNDGYDVTDDEVIEALSEKIIDYAYTKDDAFTSDRENAAEFSAECERNGDE